MRRFSDSYYRELEQRLLALTDLVEQAAPDLAKWFYEYLAAGEYGLAVEVLAETLEPAGAGARELAAGLLPEAEQMELPAETIARLRSVAA